MKAFRKIFPKFKIAENLLIQFKFSETDLRGARFNKSQLQGCSFRRALFASRISHSTYPRRLKWTITNRHDSKLIPTAFLLRNLTA